MTDSLHQVEKLLELQKRQAERALGLVIQQRDQLRLKAGECRASAFHVSEKEQDVATSLARDQWQQAQIQQANEYERQAHDLQPEIDRLSEALREQLKKHSGVKEILLEEFAKAELLEEQKADDDMLTIIQLREQGL